MRPLKFLNKSATVRNLGDSLSEERNNTYRWLSVPRWYLWDGGFLLIGQARGVVPAHSHHAIQIVISLDEPFAVCGHDENWLQGRGIVVRPDVVHSFDCSGAFGAMLLSIRSLTKEFGCEPCSQRTLLLF